MPVSIMQAQSNIKSDMEPDVLIVQNNQFVDPHEDTTVEYGYDRDADFLTEWLRKVFCTMTLGRLARRLAKHTGYLMEVDPHKPKPVQDEESLKLRLWKKMLRSVVPIRPEFTDDPEACAAHIRERYKKHKLDLETASREVEGLEEWKEALEEMAIPEYADNLTACRNYVENRLRNLRSEIERETERQRKDRKVCEVPYGMSVVEYISSLRGQISKLEERLRQRLADEARDYLRRKELERQAGQKQQPPPIGDSSLPSRLALDAARRILTTIDTWCDEHGNMPSADTIAGIIDQVTMLPKWQAALEGLAPSGPEYVDNPVACAWYVQAKLSEIQDKLRQTTEEPTPKKERCKTCDGQGWLFIDHYYRPSIERCGVCQVFFTDAAALNHVAQLASDAARIAEHQKSQGL